MPDTALPGEEIQFSLEWLLGAATNQPKKALTVCADGHLVVNENTHWAPVRMAADLAGLWCRMTDHGGGR